MTQAQHVDELVDLLSVRGKEAYFGEPVSVLEHSLQCAHLPSSLRPALRR